MHSYVKLGIVAGLLVFLFHHDIRSIVARWFSDPSWSHGILIPLFSLYFINQKRDEILGLEFVGDPLADLLRGKKPGRLRPGQTRSSYFGLFLLFVAFAVYIFNRVSPSGYAYLRVISIIAALGSIVLFLGGWGLLRRTWLPVAFLIFAVPLPNRFYVGITMPMRQLAARVATLLLNLVEGMDASVSGVVIDVVYEGRHLEPALNVAEACSGMRLLMAFLALGVAMAYLHDRPIWQRLILLVVTVPIAVLCNIVRVTVTGFIYIFIHPRYTQGFYHDMLGMAMLPLAFGLYWALAWFLESLFIEERHSVRADVIIRGRR